MADTKLNYQRGLFFRHHPNAGYFLFTSDEQAFLPGDENNANAHAGNLRLRKQKDNVDKIMREEFNAWWPDESKRLLDEAQAEFDKAQKAYDEAEAAQKGLLKTAKIDEQGKAARAVVTASGALLVATMKLKQAKEDAGVTDTVEVPVDGGGAGNGDGNPGTGSGADAGNTGDDGKKGGKGKKG